MFLIKFPFFVKKKKKIRPTVVYQELLNILHYNCSKNSLIYRVLYVYSLTFVIL